MKPEEFLTTLRSLRSKLFSAQVQNHFLAETDQEIRERFVSLRQEVTILVDRLEIGQLHAIANKLDELADDFEAGISNLQGKLDKLDKAIAILDTLSTVLGVTARIVAFAS